MRLMLKYTQEAIVPWHLTNEQDPSQKMEMFGGEVVTWEYLQNYDTDADYEELDVACRKLFGMTFAAVLAVWSKRRPDLEFKKWYRVKMHKVEENEQK